VTIAQVTHDPSDLGKCYDVRLAAVGDAKLVVRQMIEEVAHSPRYHQRANSGSRAKEVDEVKRNFLMEWMPLLTSKEKPINPYRVVWELSNSVDRTKTVVTHDAGNPRDQMTPFYEAIVPRGYLGWGKTTQLGTGLGLVMGAKLARPDWTAINLMGDAAFGMVAADVETAVRVEIPVTTIVMNNGVMGGYGKFMPVATQRFHANRLSGRYSELARALGAYSEAVEDPEEVAAAIKRCVAQNRSGKAALLEVFTCEEARFSL
jgi:acetolactate synthase-1/2/3 large subunit